MNCLHVSPLSREGAAAQNTLQVEHTAHLTHSGVWNINYSIVSNQWNTDSRWFEATCEW